MVTCSATKSRTATGIDSYHQSGDTFATMDPPGRGGPPIPTGLNPEESRNKRLERQQARFRDRGGIFVPSSRNTLLEVLLSRTVNGESPRTAAARQAMRRRSTSASPLRPASRSVNSQSPARRKSLIREISPPAAGSSKLDHTEEAVAKSKGKRRQAEDRALKKRRSINRDAELVQSDEKSEPKPRKRSKKASGIDLAPPEHEPTGSQRSYPRKITKDNRASSKRSKSTSAKASGIAQLSAIPEEASGSVPTNDSLLVSPYSAPKLSSRKGKAKVVANPIVDSGYPRNSKRQDAPDDIEPEPCPNKTKEASMPSSKSSSKKRKLALAISKPTDPPVNASVTAAKSLHTQGELGEPRVPPKKRKQDEAPSDEHVAPPPRKRPKKQGKEAQEAPAKEKKAERKKPSSGRLKENGEGKHPPRPANKPKVARKLKLSKQPPKTVLERIQRSLNEAHSVDDEPDPIDFLR